LFFWYFSARPKSLFKIPIPNSLFFLSSINSRKIIFTQEKPNSSTGQKKKSSNPWIHIPVPSN